MLLAQKVLNTLLVLTTNPLFYLSTIFVLLMLYYWFYVRSAARHFQKNNPPLLSSSDTLPTVSVVIPARNEAGNLSQCLASVLNQNYPSHLFEVILINDDSEDETGLIADQIAQNTPNLSVIHLKEKGLNSYKKAALTKGIDQAKGEIILQTDADCIVGKKWISSMMGFFCPKTAIVSGPVKFTYQSSVFEKIQTLEFMGLNILGAGSIAMKKPNMCNGANLAFRKSVFQQLNGYEGVDNVASGDDELLLQKIHKTKQYIIRYASTYSAIVSTPALPTLKDLFRQRIRWVSKSRSYIDRTINLTQMVFFLAILGIPLLLALTPLSMYMLIPALLILSLKIHADRYLMYLATRFFGEPHLICYLLLLEIAYIPYVIYVGIAGNLVETYQWKGRTTR